VINVHAPNRNSKNHTKFISELTTTMIKIKKTENAPVICAGDFNCNSSSTNQFITLKKLFDNKFEDEIITRKNNSIDHILVYKIKIKNIKTTNYELVSDHNLISGSINIIVKKEKKINNLKIKSFNPDKIDINKKINILNYKEIIYKACDFKISSFDTRSEVNVEILMIKIKIKKLVNSKKNKYYTLVEKLKRDWKKELKKYQKEKYKKLKEFALLKPYLFLKKKKRIIDISYQDLKSLGNNNKDQVFNKCDTDYWFNPKKNKLNINEISFKLEEFLEIINYNYKNKKNSSAGIDLIDYNLLFQISKIPNINFDNLITDFNNIINMKSNFPKDFTTGRIIPIEKNDGGFRPICVCNCLYKIFSILLLKKINCIKINRNQMGFQKMRGCDINLVKLHNKIDNYLLNNKKFYGSVWDFQCAFNNVPFNFINLVLKKNGLKKNIRSCIMKMLNSYITFNNFKVLTTSGTQQGMPISPFIFNLCIDILLNKLDEFLVFNLGYADDILTIAKSKNQSVNVSEIFKNFCLFSGFILNYKKTQLFNNKNEAVDSFKYLGINFNIVRNKLSTTKHIKTKIEEVKIIMEEVLRKKFISNSFKIKYLNSILSKISYGSIIYYKYKEIMKVFKCFYYQKIKILLKLPKNTSDEILLKLGVSNICKKIITHKITTLISIINQDEIMSNIIKKESFEYGYPGFPCNFNKRMINKNFTSELNNILLENKFIFCTFKSNNYSSEKLNIRARKNLLNVNKFFTINNNYLKIRKEVGYKFHSTSVMIKNNNFLPINVNTLIYKGAPIKKEEVKVIINKFEKIRWDVQLSLINIKITNEPCIRLKILLIEKLFPTFELLNKYDSNIDPTCKICKKEIESIYHLINNCEGTNHIRMKYNLDNYHNINYLLKNIKFINEIWMFRNLFIKKINQ
jgi:hypothetical protein